MEKNVRELTAREKQRIGRLVKDRCANYLEEDFFTGCLPLDCECPMLGKAYCGNAMCRYFRESVLPNDPELEAVLTGVAAKRCRHCGKLFPVAGRKAYCSEDCRAAAKRAQTAERVQKHRQKQAEM